MKYRFTEAWARVTVVLGLIIVGLGFVFGIIIGFIGREASGPFGVERWLAALLIILVGVLLGGPLVVSGELMLIFLDKRRLLGMIHRRLRIWEKEREEERRRLRSQR